MSLIRRSNLFPTPSFFDDFLTRDLFDWSGWTSNANTVPRVNIRENNDDFWVEMAAPGLKKEDFQISLDNDTLSIESVEKNEHQEQQNQHQYSRREFNYHAFKRSFYLPNTVEAEKIQAKYENGVLYLLIPKKEEARRKPARNIKIS